MEAPVRALVDAMFRLPAKLDRLLINHGNMLPRGAKYVIPLIKQELENMVAILQRYDESGLEDRTMTAKCITKELRELSYDMEDFVDQYEHAANFRRLLLPRGTKYKITRRKGKNTALLREKLKWRLWMAKKIREFSTRSEKMIQRYNSFHLGGISISTPVGIDGPIKKLEAWLLAKDGEQKLKVVSVVGSGGVGKTTLANELYHRISGQFDCRAFVRASRKPDVRRLLISMLSQVRPNLPPHTWKVHSLIADIKRHLQDKRYLIIIDDVWATSTWDIVSRALPDGNLCSATLITTETQNVAQECSGYDSKYVFTMKPLGEDYSRKLFVNTAFGPRDEYPVKLTEVSNDIVRKCAGLPLAIVTVASLQFSPEGKSEQWDYVNKSFDSDLTTDPSEGMKQVVKLSYNNLPQHLKPCVMYLSIYQEDYIIWKDDLVKQWIAEGFIRAAEDKDKEKISRSYFDELISRRMIQPAHIDDNNDVLSCTVHHTVLDFITHKSFEENFVTVIDHCQKAARLADNVRRLSLQFGNTEATPPSNMRLSQVRTLAFFGVFKCLPSMVQFGLLKVLIFHLWGDDKSISFDLTAISELCRLKYLHIICNVTLELSKTKMRGLQYLETLKLHARVSAVPPDIVYLPRLLHLSLPVETNLPNGIGQMTSLCTLGYFDLNINSTENVHSLGELTNLQDLRLSCSTVPSYYVQNQMDSMGSTIAKLCNLRSLTLEPSSKLDIGPSSLSISCDVLRSMSSAPAHLRRFEWLPHICTFSSLPKWIGYLSKLCILKIGIMGLARNDVDVLRELDALAVLSLYVRRKPAERIFFTKKGFSVLKYFEFRCRVPYIEFEAESMPNLQKLKLDFDAQGADQHDTLPVGIEHLSGLKEISAKIGGASADDPDRKAAESALSEAIEMHPAHPKFNAKCVDWMFHGMDDDKIVVQEEKHTTLQNQQEIMEEDFVEHDTSNSVQEKGYMSPQKQYEIQEKGPVEQQDTIQKGSMKDALSRFPVLLKRKSAADKQTSSYRRKKRKLSKGAATRWDVARASQSTSNLAFSLSSDQDSQEPIWMEEMGVVQWIVSAGTNIYKAAQLSGDAFHLLSCLPKARMLIDRAEWGRFKDNDLAFLLSRLKDTTCNAEDLLREIDDQELRQKMEESGRSRASQLISSSLNFFKVWISGTKERLKKAQSNLEKIMVQIERMLNSKGLNVEQPQIGSPHMPVTTSVICVPQVLGRHKERDQVIERLGVPLTRGGRSARAAGKKASTLGASAVASPSRAAKRLKEVTSKGVSTKPATDHVSILPIVGIGGVGKSTFAQFIYNDPRVESHFDIRLWVSVSNIFDKRRITKEIIEFITGEELCSSRSLDALQVELKELLMGQKFLLVLDDVWPIANKTWEAFYAPLRAGHDGSIVLLTTRFPKVANLVNSVNHIELEGLPRDVFWQFFKTCAFNENSPESYPHLQVIGRRIADRLCRSPLAAQTVGRMLSMNLTKQWWSYIQNSELWELPHEENDILPALQLTYLYLPRELKRCFAICSIFPKGYSFEKDEIVAFWVAQCFLESQGTMRLEDIGYQYLDELRSMFLFQTDPMFPSRYVMHDLIHDMAQSVSVGECFLMENMSYKNIQRPPHTVRHLSIEVNNEAVSRMGGITHLNKLHSLRLGAIFEVEVSWFKHLSNILYLSLKGCKLVKLPETICELKSLRCLDISDSSIQELPKKLWFLYSLQYFYANRLKAINQDVTKLVNLRHLELPPEATLKLSTLSGLGNMSCLQNLKNFEVGEGNGRRIDELKGMHQLSGKLCIHSLDKVQNTEEASKARLVEKKYLKELYLGWGLGRCLSSTQTGVLEGLHPPSSIESLRIDYFGGDSFPPSWFNKKNLNALRTLHISNSHGVKRFDLQRTLDIEALTTSAGGSLQWRTQDLAKTGANSKAAKTMEKFTFKYPLYNNILAQAH